MGIKLLLKLSPSLFFWLEKYFFFFENCPIFCPYTQIFPNFWPNIFFCVPSYAQPQLVFLARKVIFIFFFSKIVQLLFQKILLFFFFLSLASACFFALKSIIFFFLKIGQFLAFILNFLPNFLPKLSPSLFFWPKKSLFL